MSRDLLAVLEPAPRVLILPHDNPDPDSLASSLGLAALVRHCLDRPSVIALGGIVGRSQNRAMVRALEIPLVPVEELDPELWEHVLLVDTQPGRHNNSLPPGTVPRAVVDHHPDWGENAGVPFVDLREKYGAVATIVTEYLREHEVPLDARLATGLYFAIVSETLHFSRETSPADLAASRLLQPRVSAPLLARIETPELSGGWFQLMADAVRATIVCEDVMIALVPSVPYPDAVAEVAELLVRHEGAAWAVAIAPHGPSLYVSVRSQEPEARAGLLLARLLPSGAAGGHGMTAGGRVDLAAPARWQAPALELAKALVQALGRDGARADWLLTPRSQRGRSRAAGRLRRALRRAPR